MPRGWGFLAQRGRRAGARTHRGPLRIDHCGRGGEPCGTSHNESSDNCPSPSHPLDGRNASKCSPFARQALPCLVPAAQFLRPDKTLPHGGRRAHSSGVLRWRVSLPVPARAAAIRVEHAMVRARTAVVERGQPNDSPTFCTCAPCLPGHAGAALGPGALERHCDTEPQSTAGRLLWRRPLDGRQPCHRRGAAQPAGQPRDDGGFRHDCQRCVGRRAADRCVSLRRVCVPGRHAR
jgi:hypothetical protein